MLYQMASDPLMYDQVARAIVQLYGVSAPARPGWTVGPPASTPEAPAGSPARADPGRARTIFFPTAYTTEKGKASFATMDLGYWDINYGIGENIEIGLRTGPPVGLFAFMPQLKIALPFDGGAVAFHGLGGFFLPAVGNRNWTLYIVGGGPTLSLGKNLVFSIGTEVYGIFITHDSLGLVLPYAGLSLSLGTRVSLGVEFVAPGVFDSHHSLFGEIEFLLWGLRIKGERIWGDIGFVDPICKGGCGGFYRIMPLGCPLLNLGVNF